MDYLDLGSSSDSDDGCEGIDGRITAMDSDEEEIQDNNRILKMLRMKPTESRANQKMLDFEAEMEAELDRRATLVEAEGGMEHQRSLSRSSSSSSLQSLKQSTGSKLAIEAGPSSSLKSSSSPKKKVKFANVPPQTEEGESANPNQMSDDPPSTYDEVYFDSDESEGENDTAKKRRKAKRKVLTNDELFYDPESDAADQAWVDKQRRQYFQPGAKKITQPVTAVLNSMINSTNDHSEGGTASNENQNTETSPSNPDNVDDVPSLPSTDAVLNCPACFTVLCMDCQRHEFYSGQFRAMFVMNCKVDKSETLTVPLKSNNKSRGKKRRGNLDVEETVASLASSSSDQFYPVRCKVCNSQVAVYDSDEIFHFFNILASHP